MADTGIFATTEQVQDMVGVNASTVSNVEAFINRYIKKSENKINARLLTDYTATYAALSNNFKEILTVAAAADAAKQVLMYDTTGFANADIELKIDYLTDEYEGAMRQLEDKDRGQDVIALVSS